MTINKHIILHELNDDIIDGYLFSLNDTSFSEVPKLWEGFLVPEYIHCPFTHSVVSTFQNSTSAAVTAEGGRNGPYWKRHYRDEKYWYTMINFRYAGYPLMNKVKYDVFFQEAVKSGFYEDVSLVDAFIYDFKGGNCIGYRMPILNCLPTGVLRTWSADLKMHERLPDDEKLNDLITRVLSKSKKLGLVLTDFGGFNHSNVMEFENRYYIIDLECITSLQVWREGSIRTHHFKHCYKEYVDGISKIA